MFLYFSNIIKIYFTFPIMNEEVRLELTIYLTIGSVGNMVNNVHLPKKAVSYGSTME